MSIPRALRFRVLARDGFACRYCGRRAPDVVLEVDHRQPRSRGGGDADHNLVTACHDCNRGKRDKLLPTERYVLEQRACTMAVFWAYGTLEILGEYGDVESLDMWRVGNLKAGTLYTIMERTLAWIRETPPPRPKGSDYLRDLVVAHLYPALAEARCG